MAPPWMERDVHGSLPQLWSQGNITGESLRGQQQQEDDSREPAQRHDSPVESRNSVPQILELNSDGNTHAFPDVAYSHADDQDAHKDDTDMATLQRPRQATVTPTPSGPNTDDEDLPLFVMVGNPTAKTNKTAMRDIRQHVMHDFLRKERRKTSGPRDSRVETPAMAGAKRKRNELGPVHMPGGAVREVSLNPSNPGYVFRPRLELTPASSIRSTASSLCESESDASLAVSNDSPTKSQPAIVQQQRRERSTSAGVEQVAKPSRLTASPLRAQNEVTQAPSEQPLMLPWRVKLEQTGYITTDPDTVPFPFTRSDLGTRINPFETWPCFDNPRINVRSLKYQCGVYFGSRGLMEIWVPVLLRARHAFLSTICVATGHERAMRSIHGGPGHEKGNHEHMRVRGEVLTMINMVVAKERAERGAMSDETIAAVLQLLMGEVMAESPEVVAGHESILTQMVYERGGLESTRTDRLRGHLPAILTVTLYVVAVLHEKLPDDTYVKFAGKRHAEPTRARASKPFPENPVFCGDGYVAVRRAVGSESPMLELLDLLRLMTNGFTSAQARVSGEDLTQLKERIDAFNAVDENRFATEATKRFEVVRLTARLYAHALANGLPFSQASKESGVKAGEIVRALMRTSLSDCWDHTAGVLFWISLVAGAAAKSATHPSDTFGEAARKYLSATAIRCSIVLGFEHGLVVLETLKRIVGIQQVLAQHSQALPPAPLPPPRRANGPPQSSANSGQLVVQSRSPRLQQRPEATTGRQSGHTDHLTVPVPQRPRYFGPAKPAMYQQQPQRGFSDFARDFSA